MRRFRKAVERQTQRSELTVKEWRPLARRRASTARPPGDRMRTRKPCVLARRRRLGWKVRFGIPAPVSVKLLDLDYINYGLNRVRFPAALSAGSRLRRAGRSPAWSRSGWIGELAHHGQHLWGGLRSGADFSPQPGCNPAAVTGTDGFSSASALITAIMVAPPAMWYFIFSMPSAGLMEMPPATAVGAGVPG